MRTTCSRWSIPTITYASELRSGCQARSCGGAHLQVASVERLGRQAAQFIATAADPLAALVDLPGSFPSKAAALSRLGTTREARASAATLKRILPAGACWAPTASLTQPDCHAGVEWVRHQGCAPITVALARC